MIFKIKTNYTVIKKINKSDRFVLEFHGNLDTPPKNVIVKVVEILTDKPRCVGCKMFFEGSKRFKFNRHYYCESCYKQRVIKAQKSTTKGAKTRKLNTVDKFSLPIKPL
jgi:transposase-like protein